MANDPAPPAPRWRWGIWSALILVMGISYGSHMGALVALIMSLCACAVLWARPRAYGRGEVSLWPSEVSGSPNWKLPRLEEVVTEGIARVDLTGEMVAANSVFRSWFGEASDAPADLRRVFKQPREAALLLAAIGDGDAWESVVELRINSGDAVFKHARAFPIVTAKGLIEGGVLVLAHEREKGSTSGAENGSGTLTDSHFLAQVSHEIRTPLTAMMGFADMLGEEFIADAEGKETLASLRRNGEHVIAIVNDILDLSGMTTGQLLAAHERVAIGPILNDVLGMFQTKCAAKGIELSLTYGQTMPEVILSDGKRLRQIITNLLGNAIKFTEQGQVALRVAYEPISETHGELRVAVKDTGIGMSEEVLARVFEPLFQGSGINRRFGGSGLGLAIAQQWARLLGGKIQATSREGFGSEFVVTLRVERAAGVMKETSGRTANRDRSLVGCRVLLAEDSPDSARVLTHFLRKAGAVVELAENGAEGAELALSAARESKPFDVILMDIEMPVLDGYEATREIRRELKSAVVLGLTAHAGSEVRTRFIAAGGDDVMTKPVVRAEFLDFVGRWAGSSERETMSATASLVS